MGLTIIEKVALCNELTRLTKTVDFRKRLVTIHYMNCPKHPSQKMVQLFTSQVCDLCDPPKTKDNSATTKGHPAVGFCSSHSPDSDRVCFLYAGHYCPHNYQLRCKDQNGYGRCRIHAGHGGNHVFTTPSKDLSQSIFSVIFKQSYPYDVSGRTETITQLIDAGALTKNDFKRSIDYEVD